MAVRDLVERFAGTKVLVVGDVMLDEYNYGDVRRISPEAPVPVLSIKSSKRVGGGAANVALNASAMGAAVTLIGVAGDDGPAASLGALLDGGRHPLKPHIIRDPARRTTVKTRFAAGTQQLLRVDQEESTPLSPATQAKLLDALTREMAASDVVILSDYGKGLLTDTVLRGAFQQARRLGKPTIVDPKRQDFRAYNGATVIKPNLSELRMATNGPCETQAQIDAAARLMAETIGGDVLLTRSERGMSYYAAGQAPVHREAHAKEVFDVSGAGDTVIAAFGTARAAGYSATDAMEFANAAAGIAVARLGTVVVTVQDIVGALIADTYLEPLEHVVSIERAVAACRLWRGQGLKVGFTNGCFDILHAGHVSLLAKSAAACDRLVVGLNSDASVRRLKGPTRPAQNELSRAQVLASLDSVDLVVPFEQDTPLDLIEALAPDVLIKGADYTQDQVVGGDFVKASGGRVMLIDLVEGHSTTNTLRRLQSRG